MDSSNQEKLVHYSRILTNMNVFVDNSSLSNKVNETENFIDDY